MDIEKYWINLPLPPISSIIINLSENDVFNLCLTSKKINKKICGNINLWNYLSRVKYGTICQKIGFEKRFFYGQGYNLYKYDNSMQLIRNNVVYVSSYSSYMAFITLDSNLYTYLNGNI